MRTAPSRLLVWSAMWVIYVIWGSTYLGIRVMDETMQPFVGAALRFLLVGVIMAAFIGLRRGPEALRVSARELGALALVGALLLVGGNGLLVYAEKDVPSGIASLVVASVPLWIVLFRLVARDRPGAASIGGTLLGFVGVGVLVVAHDRPEGASVGGLLIILACSASWALGSYAAARLPLPRDALVGTTYEMLAGGALLAALAAVSGELGSSSIDSVSLRSWIGLAYLVTFGSLLAYTAYIWLLQNVPISTVATYAYVNPAVAILLGAVVLSEPVTWSIVAAGAIIVVAVAIVVTAEGRAERSAAQTRQDAAAEEERRPDGQHELEGLPAA